MFRDEKKELLAKYPTVFGHLGAFERRDLYGESDFWESWDDIEIFAQYLSSFNECYKDSCVRYHRSWPNLTEFFLSNILTLQINHYGFGRHVNKTSLSWMMYGTNSQDRLFANYLVANCPFGMDCYGFWSMA